MKRSDIDEEIKLSYEDPLDLEAEILSRFDYPAELKGVNKDWREKARKLIIRRQRVVDYHEPTRPQSIFA